MKFVLVLLALIATAQSSLAQMNAVGTKAPVISRGIGGAWEPMNGGKTSIRLVEQEIHITLPERRVRARSTFHNAGAATTVAMALPESGETFSPGNLKSGGFLRELQARVDKRHIALKMLTPEGTDYESDYKILWTQPLRFARGQTRVLEESFISGVATSMLAPESGAYQYFIYDLRGSRAWKGTVKRLRVVVEAQGLRGYSEVTFSPQQGRRSGDKTVWEWRDSEPVSTFTASWWPGFSQIFVDNRRAWPLCAAMENQHTKELELVYPQRRRSSIWVPLRLIKEWLPPAKDGADNALGQGAYRAMRGINWGARNIGVEIGSRYLDVTAPGITQKIAMTAPAYDERGMTMVELGPTILALGGKILWDSKKQQVHVKFR